MRKITFDNISSSVCVIRKHNVTFVSASTCKQTFEHSNQNWEETTHESCLFGREHVVV